VFLVSLVHQFPENEIQTLFILWKLFSTVWTVTIPAMFRCWFCCRKISFYRKVATDSSIKSQQRYWWTLVEVRLQQAKHCSSKNFRKLHFEM
jgi:hypothetical protein